MSNVSTILVIFGITGDLAQRKLLPALRNIILQGEMENTKIVGISRRQVKASELIGNLKQKYPDDVAVIKLEKMLTVFSMDVARPDDYGKLRQEITKFQKTNNSETIFYLSVPPQASLPIIEHLGSAGLNGVNTKILVEKPFGVDLDSAKETIDRIDRYYSEEQIYRIDHYLAKEMTQNILTFRSQNAIFRSLWNKEFIEKIDIIAGEKIGIEGRAVFYEQTGALRDFVQNHLMQLLSLVLMDLPDSTNTNDVLIKRLDALKAIEPLHPESSPTAIIRGQYEGYSKEVENPGSLTETFVCLQLKSSSPRWKGVPIRLVTGKKLAAKTTEIRIYFKQTHANESNRLVLHIQPKEGVEIDLFAKKPGYEKTVEPVHLSFAYDRTKFTSMDAYERVLIDAMYADKSLFTSAEEVLRSWEILQPVQDRWDFHTDDLRIYKPGATIEEILA